jgi:DNA-directed RNA polymerase subunit L
VHISTTYFNTYNAYNAYNTYNAHPSTNHGLAKECIGIRPEEKRPRKGQRRAMPPSDPRESSMRVIKIPGEDHTLGTALTAALWTNPHVTVAQYAQKHPVNREEIAVHCQTDAAISATASIEEAVALTKRMLTSLDEEMKAALEAWDALPEAQRRARNRQGKGRLELQLEEAMEDMRHGRLDDDDGMRDDDNPFLAILRASRHSHSALPS